MTLTCIFLFTLFGRFLSFPSQKQPNHFFVVHWLCQSFCASLADLYIYLALSSDVKSQALM
ncbi:hypothetical protein ACB098_06G147700 [Castanea mollissima]